MILTIDGGTTNTRFCIMDQGNILSSVKMSAGIRNTLSAENREEYLTAVREMIRQVTEPYHDSVEAVVASGMIASETGIYTCPHLVLPQDFGTLAQAMHRVELPALSHLPFYFIPGLKTFADPLPDISPESIQRLADMDIMRGEETELAGIYAKMGLQGDLTFLLPGSHMKYIQVNRNGRITAFRTSLAGELLRAVTEHTILRSSLDQVYPNAVDAECLQNGYHYARKYSVTEAMFKVRVLEKFGPGISSQQLYSFLLGIVLSDDVEALCRTQTHVYIGGSDLFRSAFRLLLEERNGTGTVQEIPAEIANSAAAYGAEWLYGKRQ